MYCERSFKKITSSVSVPLKLFKKDPIMTRIVCVLCIIVMAGWSFAYSSSIDSVSAKIAVELQKGDKRSTQHDIAIGDFVTPDYPHADFGKYFTESLGEAMQRTPSFKIIDQDKVTKVLTNRMFFFNQGYEYTALDSISQDIYKTAQETPTAFCFGKIMEIGDEIKITAKLIDAITGATITTASVAFPSDEITDKLLGKPIRERKPGRRDTVVVVKERVIEKVVERAGEKPIDHPKMNTDSRVPASQGFNIQGFSVTLKKCSFAGDELIFAFSVLNENDLTKVFSIERGRIVDPDGNAIDCNRVTLGTISGGYIARTDLISNVAVNAFVSFKGVSPKFTTIKALQLTAEGHEFVLRDIVVEK
jgi:TolB-like protein